jgi:hypothetical protein
MITRKIPYTDKFPYMYQVELKGYIIQTTKEESFNKLVEYLTLNCMDDNYHSIPANKRLQIEMSFTVKMTQ